MCTTGEGAYFIFRIYTGSGGIEESSDWFSIFSCEILSTGSSRWRRLSTTTYIPYHTMPYRNAAINSTPTPTPWHSPIYFTLNWTRTKFNMKLYLPRTIYNQLLQHLHTSQFAIFIGRHAISTLSKFHALKNLSYTEISSRPIVKHRYIFDTEKHSSTIKSIETCYAPCLSLVTVINCRQKVGQKSHLLLSFFFSPSPRNIPMSCINTRWFVEPLEIPWCTPCTWMNLFTR